MAFILGQDAATTSSIDYESFALIVTYYELVYYLIFMLFGPTSFLWSSYRVGKPL